jgi:hypothetical protein
MFLLFLGLTAIEAWMLACILFVFGALVEYAAILFRRQTVPDEDVRLNHDATTRKKKEILVKAL